MDSVGADFPSRVRGDQLLSRARIFAVSKLAVGDELVCLFAMLPVGIVEVNWTHDVALRKTGSRFRASPGSAKLRDTGSGEFEVPEPWCTEFVFKPMRLPSDPTA